MAPQRYSPVRLIASLILLGSELKHASAFGVAPHRLLSQRGACHVETTTLRQATVAPPQEETASAIGDLVLKTMCSLREESNDYAETFGLSQAEAAFYAFFAAIRHASVPLGLKGEPFVLRHDQVVQAMQQETFWPGFFTMDDLSKALSEDFLDAARGSTDNRKGWKISDVSLPRGDSFEEARMTFADVQAALEKGTVIFNAAGAHIPKLAGPSLALTDGTLLPGALNLYVTNCGKRTSAPPHTDKQVRNYSFSYSGFLAPVALIIAVIPSRSNLGIL